MSDDPSASATLAKVVSKYRESMAASLQASLAGINDFLSSVDLEGIFGHIDPAEFDADPSIAFKKMSYLLIGKARLHIIAALHANKEGNIHSLAVQMRPALECAGQVVSMFEDLFGREPGAEDRISRYINADYYQTVIRLSKGQIGHNEILHQINTTIPVETVPLRKIRSFRESEKVKDLEFGDNWYSHLSECFFHSDLPALKNHSYFGGVSSCNTMYDEYGFAALLDYLAHMIMVMVMYAATRWDDALDEERHFEKIVELLEKKRVVSEGFRRKCMSMAGVPDSRAAGSGVVR